MRQCGRAAATASVMRAIEPHQVGVELADAPRLHAAQLGITRCSSWLLSSSLRSTNLPSGGNQFGQMLAWRIVLHRAGWQGGDEAGDGSRIEPVVLRQHPAALANCRSFHGIDRADRQTGVQQGGDDAAFVSAAGSMPIARAPSGRSRRHQLAPAGAVVADAEPCFRSDATATSSRSLETSIPTLGANCAIFCPCLVVRV